MCFRYGHRRVCEVAIVCHCSRAVHDLCATGPAAAERAVKRRAYQPCGKGRLSGLLKADQVAEDTIADWVPLAARPPVLTVAVCHWRLVRPCLPGKALAVPTCVGTSGTLADYSPRLATYSDGSLYPGFVIDLGSRALSSSAVGRTFCSSATRRTVLPVAYASLAMAAALS